MQEWSECRSCGEQLHFEVMNTAFWNAKYTEREA